MDVSSAVRAMIASKGLKLREVSRAMGRSEALVGNSLNKEGGMSTRTIVPIAEICGYKLVLIPKDVSVDNSFTIE